ncbi:hypothetical protein PQX77_017241 [Marasmius sp. AFHP31]|nr:hypothetical protein PQX77_017241 [Marasmius sp. AFHP31]
MATDQTIINHRFVLCPKLQMMGYAELIRQCDFCGHFFAACCSDLNKSPMCRHWPLIFTDGACLDNGSEVARAGVGVAVGSSAASGFSIPFSNLDCAVTAGKRTSQRAELLAALEGINRASGSTERCYKSKLALLRNRESGDPCWIITTDSEYVVKGITEWLPKWKRNGFRNASGNKVSNIDLFTLLDEKITQMEATSNVRIGFWHVPREFNTIADVLTNAPLERTRAAGAWTVQDIEQSTGLAPGDLTVMSMARRRGV